GGGPGRGGGGRGGGAGGVGREARGGGGGGGGAGGARVGGPEAGAPAEGAAGAARAAEGCAAASPSAVSKMARSVPIATVWPSSTLTSLRVPATGDGISVFTLSVWTSTRRSYLFTLSPGCFSHFPIVPSVTDSPSFGIFSSNAISLP